MSFLKETVVTYASQPTQSDFDPDDAPVPHISSQNGGEGPILEITKVLSVLELIDNNYRIPETELSDNYSLDGKLPYEIVCSQLMAMQRLYKKSIIKNNLILGKFILLGIIEYIHINYPEHYPNIFSTTEPRT